MTAGGDSNRCRIGRKIKQTVFSILPFALNQDQLEFLLLPMFIFTGCGPLPDIVEMNCYLEVGNVCVIKWMC